MSAHIKLQHADIIIGRPLPWSVYDSNASLLLREGFVVATIEMAERLISRGAYAQKDDVLASQSPSLQQPKLNKPKDISPFKIIEDVISQLALILASSDSEEVNFTNEIMALVKEVQRACDRDINAALASLFILEAHSYPIKHSVDVAILTDIIAQRIGILREERQSIVAAALTMNIAQRVTVLVKELIHPWLNSTPCVDDHLPPTSSSPR